MNYDRQEYRRAFSMWLRTGRWPDNGSSSLERKFNPYHDPRNGRFTFAPGGARPLSRATFSTQRRKFGPDQSPDKFQKRPDRGEWVGNPATTDAVYWPDQHAPLRMQPIAGGRSLRRTRAGGMRTYDPIVLGQVFPGLEGSPAGAIVEIADYFLEFTKPLTELTTEISLQKIQSLVAEIKALNPKYHLDSFGFASTAEGQIAQINTLRFDRAVLLLHLKGEWGPLQVETLRFMRTSVDRAYERGKELLKKGELKIVVSEEMTLGNFVDEEVRSDLRKWFNRYGIDVAGKGPIRVNRREYGKAMAEAAFRRPDVRIGNVAFDVTLEEKTLKKPQIREFFQADFQPDNVVIVRPSQLGPKSIYLITRPGEQK